MPKHTGRVDHRPDAGITKLFHRLHDGDWCYETIQDCDPIVDANKQQQNETAPRGDFRLQARIPLIFRQKWIDEHGVDFLSRDPDVQAKVDRLLDDPDYRWMRTSTGTLQKRAVSKAEIERRVTKRNALAEWTVAS